MEFLKKFTYKKWWLYCLRWISSGAVIAPVTAFAMWLGFSLSWGVTFGNIAGASIYWHFDKFLLCDTPSRYKILNLIKEKLK